jgi:hypothetical protein
MTEVRALVLAIGGLLVVSLGAIFLLASIGAGIEVLALVYILALCLGAYASSSIVMHYGSKRRGR